MCIRRFILRRISQEYGPEGNVETEALFGTTTYDVTGPFTKKSRTIIKKN